jgi:hypothetical protein
MSLAACSNPGTPSAAVPTPNQSLVQAISQKVAALYGENNPTIVSVKADVSESDQQPIDLVVLQGSFHNGKLSATHLSFTMLATGKKVWAVRASDDQNQTIWTATDVTV